jgi:hypothetical protein
VSAAPADTAAPMDAAPPENPTPGPDAVIDTAASGLTSHSLVDIELERAERRGRTTRFFCALAARRAAWRWAEGQHQKTERGRVAARPR